MKNPFEKKLLDHRGHRLADGCDPGARTGKNWYKRRAKEDIDARVTEDPEEAERWTSATNPNLDDVTKTSTGGARRRRQRSRFDMRPANLFSLLGSVGLGGQASPCA